VANTWAYDEHWRWWSNMMNETELELKTTPPNAPEPEPAPEPKTLEPAPKRETWQLLKKWNHLSNKINRMRDPSWGR
jgi:hypothetical protein